MKRFEFNKLIRNKLPPRMVEEGVVVNSHTLNQEEYSLKLKEKLIEEAKEVSLAESIEELKIELADVLEVIHALLENYQIPFQEIEQARLEKREINGHFTPETFIHHIEVASSNDKVINYLLNKNRPYKFES